MFGELLEWILNLDREFAFLLALPFAVAIAGLLSHAVRERKPAQQKRAREASDLTHGTAWSRGS